MKGKPKCTKKCEKLKKIGKLPRKVMKVFLLKILLVTSQHVQQQFQAISEGKVGYCDVRLNWLRKLGTTE